MRNAVKLALLVFAFFASYGMQAQAPSQLIKLTVDASESPRQIWHARLVIPVRPGPLILYYPKWIPGEHMPDGPIVNLAGLKILATGKPLAWRRDLVDMFAFHLEVPEGADTIEVQLDYLLAGVSAKYSSGASASAQLTLLSWNQVLLYPQGKPINELTYEPSLHLPEGWQFATALPVAKRSGSNVEFAPVALNTLVDSPVLAGAYFRVIPLTRDEAPRHEIDMAADSEAALAIGAEEIEHYRQLVAETGVLFGSRHYRDYHFLVSLSDDVTHFGLEHHESSDDRVPERTFLDEGLRLYEADLLPHEFVHSWNGKYRRPADLATPDYQQPMRDDLLWVYEGLTQYLGDILAARSGLFTPEQFRENVAYDAATLNYRAGREWRSLQDTADSAPFLYAAPDEWTAWRRSTDFYDEGALLWLEVDTTIRQQTRGKRTLNDFCRSFFGGSGGAPALKTYTFEELVAALNDVAPSDWKGLFTERLNSHGPHAPLGGIANGGWRLTYSDEPNQSQTATEQAHRILDLSFSLGLVVDEDGTVRDVIPGMAAAKAGLGPGMKIVAVSDRQWSVDLMRETIRGAKSSARPLELLVANGEYYKTYSLDYRGGIRYPHLERDSSHSDLLSEIIKPSASRGK